MLKKEFEKIIDEGNVAIVLVWLKRKETLDILRKSYKAFIIPSNIFSKKNQIKYQQVLFKQYISFPHMSYKIAPGDCLIHKTLQKKQTKKPREVADHKNKFFVNKR